MAARRRFNWGIFRMIAAVIMVEITRRDDAPEYLGH